MAKLFNYSAVGYEVLMKTGQKGDEMKNQLQSVNRIYHGFVLGLLVGRAD